jgi:hypothetical protein
MLDVRSMMFGDVKTTGSGDAERAAEDHATPGFRVNTFSAAEQVLQQYGGCRADMSIFRFAQLNLFRQTQQCVRSSAQYQCATADYIT